MVFRHYDEKGWVFDPQRQYSQGNFKPAGLWLSDDSQEWGWLQWCENESFRTDHYVKATDFKFKDDANILHVASINELESFQKKYGGASELYNPINWDRVSDEYDGILISPYYRWDAPISATWYYGLDVASACVWNLEAIEETDPRLAVEIEIALNELRNPKKAWEDEFDRLFVPKG